MFLKLIWLSIQHRRDFHKISIIYKCNTWNTSSKVAKHSKHSIAYYVSKLDELSVLIMQCYMQ